MCNVPNFNDFINQYPKYNQYANNQDAIKVFNFLADPPNIHKMIIANSQNKAALSGCISDLETKFNILSNFSFDNDNVKQAVGSMVKVILTPFGYTPQTQKKMPRGYSTYFKSATNYILDSNKASLKIIPTYTVAKIK